MYLADIFPVNLQKGRGFNVVLRDRYKSIFLENPRVRVDDREVGHVYYSMRMSREEAEELAASVDVKTEIVKSGGRFVVHAYGDRELKSELSGLFLTDSTNVAVDRLHEQVGFPFPKVKVEGGVVNVLSDKVSIEELLYERAAALDIEVKGWEPHGLNWDRVDLKRYIPDEYWTDDLKERLQDAEQVGNQRIAAITYATMTGFGNYIFTLDDVKGRDTEFIFGKCKEIMIDTEFGRQPFYVFVGEKPEDLIAKLNEVHSMYDPLVIFGHNVGGYDLPRLRDLHGIEFTPGINQDRVRFRRSEFFVIPHTHGKFMQDTMGTRYYLPHLLDAKLVTIASRVLKKVFMKDIGYEEQSVLSLVAEACKGEDVGLWAGERLAQYACHDAIITKLVGDDFWKLGVLRSLMLKQDPTAVCLRSKAGMSTRFRSKVYFDQLGTSRLLDRSDKEELEDFDVFKFRTDNFDLKTRRGLFRDAWLFYLPTHLVAFEALVKSDRGARANLDALKEEENPNLQVAYAVALEEIFLREPIFDLFEREVDDWMFRTRNGVVGTAGAYKRRFRDRVLFEEERLGECGIINFTDRLFVSSDKPMIDEAIVLGRGDLLSGGKGRFVMRDEFGVMGEGFGALRAESRKGHRTVYERQMVPMLLDLIFGYKFDEILDLLGEANESLLNGSMDKSSLVLASDSKMDSQDISMAARGEKSNAAREFEVSEDENYDYGFGLNGRVRVPEFFDAAVDVDKYLERWYGPLTFSTKNGELVGRQLTKGVIGDFVYSILPHFDMPRKELLKMLGLLTCSEV